jgi:hypothetical protein
MIYKDPDDGRQRFLLELEFVQCLANPTYIHCRFIKFFLFFHLSLAFIFVVCSGFESFRILYFIQSE